MSSDINPDVPPRIRCEAIPPSSTSQNLTCHRSHGTVLRYPRSGAGRPTGDDPAHLIGLALGHVQQVAGLSGVVPDRIISQLRMHAETGNPACRLPLDWLSNRNCDRLIRERRQARPGSLKTRWPTKRQLPSGKTAIIAAMTEGRIDE